MATVRSHGARVHVTSITGTITGGASPSVLEVGSAGAHVVEEQRAVGGADDALVQARESSTSLHTVVGNDQRIWQCETLRLITARRTAITGALPHIYRQSPLDAGNRGAH